MLKQPFQSHKMVISTLGRTFKTFDQNPLINSFFMSSLPSILKYFGHSLSLFVPVSRKKLPILTTKVTISGLSYVWVSLSCPLALVHLHSQPLPLCWFFSSSLQVWTYYFCPGEHVVHAPSPWPRLKYFLLFISIFLSMGMPPMHSVLSTSKLFLNFSPSYSLTSHKSGFPPQWFHFLLYFLSAMLN